MTAFAKAPFAVVAPFLIESATPATNPSGAQRARSPE